jgi:hydroxyacylglutathione hydrolase
MVSFCYLVGDRSSKKCALIDPAFETQRILGKVEHHGYTVTHVINTHYHSDHSSGNASIIAATNARLLIHQKDAKPLRRVTNRIITRLFGGKSSPAPDTKLSDGDVINIGKISLKVIHTPGHTPGGICLYGNGNIFTGDTLFVSSIGRTDLPGGSHKVLLRSIRERIYSLPGDTKIWPGHDYGPTPHSTIEKERRTNPFT